MNTSSSLEALAFQKSSQLGVALEKLFQKAIDYRDSIPFDQQKELVHKYCKTTLKQDLISAFKNTVNITIDNVVFVNRWPSCEFAIMLYTTAYNGSTLVFDNNYGLKKITNPSKEIEEILNLYKDINTSNGRLSTDNTSISPALYFDISLGLLLPHYVPIDIAEPFTAKELAAIYLHECGHFFSLVDRTRYHYFVYERMIEQLSSLSDKYQPEEVIKSILDKKDDIKKLISTINTQVDKELLQKLDLIDKATYVTNLLKSRIDNEDKEDSKDKLYVSSTLLYKCIIFILKDVLGRLLIRPFLNILDEYEDSKILLQRNSIKTSDQISTFKQDTMCEQDADEYIVRSGYGNYQASSLRKIGVIFTYINSAASNVKGFDYNLNKLSKNTLELVQSLLPFYKESYFVQFCNLYEARIDRIKRLCQMSITGIKDTSAIMQPIYLEQYEKCIKELTEVEKFGKSNIVTIQKFVNTVISSPSVFIDNLLTGRINKEYFTLQNQVEELINNKLYYYGNKFKSYLK